MGQRTRSCVGGLAVAALLAIGCTTTLTLPADVADPVPVMLLDHGYTPSLVLPPVGEEEDSAVRYAYGDWRWYAQGRQGVLDFVRALFWPSRGALGRRLLGGRVEVGSIHDAVAVTITHVHLLSVERAAVRNLAAHLDQLYQANQDALLDSTRVDLAFVPHPRSYTLLHNSNHVVAAWLRRLGVDVRGPVLLSRWRVIQHEP